MAIVDQYGNPIQRQALAEPQTARLGTLYQEFGTHPSRGLTPARLARILEDAERGDLGAQCDLFEDMEEKDAHIFAELQKRRRAILGLEWDIQPPRNATAQEQAAAALLKEMLQDLDCLDDVLLDMGDAIGKGYSCQEISWERQGREWLPARIEHRPPSWFQVNQDRQNELRLRDNTVAGAELWPFGWIRHVHKAKSGYLARAGICRPLAWLYLFKNYSARDLAEFLEICGLPMRLGTYPRGSTDAEKATLLRAVVNIGHAAAGIVPEGMMIDFKEAATGSEGPFVAMIDWCERGQSKVIVGGTLTSQTDSGSGAYALGAVHNEVRRDLLVSDARQMERALTRDLVYPLAALNLPGIEGLRRAPRFVFDTREYEDIQRLATALPPLVQVGARIPVRWVNEQTGIPAPGEDDEILQAPAAASPFAALKGRLPEGVAALRARPGNGAGVVAAATRALAQGAEDPLRAWLEQIRHMAQEVDSLEALGERLLNAYADLPEESLAELLSLAFATAEAEGRSSVVSAPLGSAGG